MKSAFLFVFTLTVCSISTTASAQQRPNINAIETPWQDNERSQQAKAQQLREDSLKSAQENTAATPQTPANTTNATPTTSTTPEQEQCLPVKRISVKGLNLISRSQRTKIYKNYPKGCITAAKLNQLVNVISQLFLESGYINVSLTQQREGDLLTWQVNVATISTVENKTTLRTANLLPAANGKPMNIKDLDQALDQANRLKGRTVTADVYPKKDNTVALTLVEEKHKSIYGNLSADNKGSDSTGREQFRANIVADNPLGIADQFSLYTNSTLPDGDRYSRGATAFYSVPYGYWTFSGSAGIYTYKTQAQLVNNTVELTGKTKRFTARAERVVSRGSRHITSAYGTIDRTGVDSRLLDSRIEVQSPTVTALTLGVNHTHLFNQSVLSADASIRQGSSELQLDAGKDKTDFRIFNTTFHWQQLLPIKGRQVSLQHHISAQYSDDDVPDVEEMSVTGTYAVRGFRNSGISGDSGFYLRETVTTGMTVGSYQLQPYLGIDVGRAWSKGVAIESAVGGVLGVSVPMKNWHFDFSVTKGKRFVRHDEDTTMPAEAYLQINWQF